MVEEVVPNLYRIEVPLPGSPLKSVNSYVFKSKERNLIVDTGLNREECRQAMEAGLREVGVELRRRISSSPTSMPTTSAWSPGW